MTALTDLLARVADPAAPLVTYYDRDTGERVELSAVTLANWIAKTSNLLVDELDAEPGTRLRLALPSHWESFVWILSAWSVGATLVADDADVAVVGPDLDADEAVRVALSLRPLGGRFPAPPAGFVDYNAEVPGHPDVFVALDPPAGDAPAVDLPGLAADHDALLAGVEPDPVRVLVRPGDLMRDVRLLVAALRGGGSLVVVAGDASGEDLAGLAEQERAAVRAD